MGDPCTVYLSHCSGDFFECSDARHGIKSVPNADLLAKIAIRQFKYQVQDTAVDSGNFRYLDLTVIHGVNHPPQPSLITIQEEITLI